MNDFSSKASLRPLSFTVTLVPGTSSVQSAVAYYEVVLESGRVVQFQKVLDITPVQNVVNNATAVIVSQLMVGESITNLWPTVAIAASEAMHVDDAGSQQEA